MSFWRRVTNLMLGTWPAVMVAAGAAPNDAQPFVAIVFLVLFEPFALTIENPHAPITLAPFDSRRPGERLSDFVDGLGFRGLTRTSTIPDLYGFRPEASTRARRSTGPLVTAVSRRRSWRACSRPRVEEVEQSARLAGGKTPVLDSEAVARGSPTSSHGWCDACSTATTSTCCRSE